MAESTDQERRNWKMKRRFGNLRDLVAGLHRKCRRSKHVEEVMNKMMPKLSRDPNIEMVRDCIRRAN